MTPFLEPTLLARAASADPSAANPDSVLAELKNWRNGGGSEIFVKVAMDEYMRDLFQGLPDEVIDAASVYIFYIDLSELN